MARIPLIYVLIRHPVASALVIGWIVALLWLGIGPGWIAYPPALAMVGLSITVPRWARRAAVARDREAAEAELEFLRVQADLNAQAIMTEWERRRS